MSYVDKLRRTRAPDAGAVRPGEPAAPRPATGGPQANGHVPATSINERTIAKRGASGALLRQTIGDVFAAAERLGLAPGLAAKHARALEREVATLDRLHRTLEAVPGGPVHELFARMIDAGGDGIAALDQASGAAAVHQIAEAISAAAARADKVGPQQATAIELFASSISKLKNAELGPELARAIAGTIALDRGGAAESAARAFAQAADGLLQSAGGEARVAIMRAGLTIALEAAKDLGRDAGQIVREAAQGVALTPGQERLLGALAGEVRNIEARREQTERQTLVEVERQKRLYDANEAGAQQARFAPLAGVKADVARHLGPAAQVVWFERMNANANQPPLALEALARVYAGVLAVEARGLPTPDARRTIDQAVVALAAIPGMTSEALAAVAADYVKAETQPERVPGTLRSVAAIVQELARANPNARDAALPALLARGLVGRQDAFAQANGPRAMLVRALAEAPDDEVRRAAARHGPRFAAAVKAAEAGVVRDLLEASFPADLAGLVKAGVDPSALAAAYPTIPEDSLLRLASIGLAHGRDLDAWFVALGDFFKNTRNSKEHVRSVRSLLSLAERGGADPTKLVDAFLRAKPRPQQVMRAVNALLNENNLDVKPAQLERAIAMLDRGEDVAEAIETELRKAMVQKLRLDQILQDANVKVTDEGYKAVSGPLAQFFTLAANSQNVDKPLLKEMLLAVLEDRFADFRFQTGATDKQLAPLTVGQRHLWRKHEAMTHVRFQADGQKELESRVRAGAKIGAALLERMTRAWGDLPALEKKHGETVARLREVPKDQLEARRKLVRELDGVPGKIEAMRWAKELAELTPETTTPLRFARLADALPSLGRMLPGMRAAIEELIWTVRIDDLSYSEVVTHDGPDLATMYKLATKNCLAGWPHDVSLLAYCIDPNKRMIVTKNQAGEERRAMMRLVERQDPGHEGQPMLVLERTYPDRVSEEEKQRLVEHMLRRATDMGIAAAYPTEYYWDASKTQRGQGAGLVDMNKVIEDLNRRYHTTAEHLTMKVLNRGGNVAFEYIDSAPLAGARDAGNVQIRKYTGNKDNVYENKFVVLTPI